MINRRYRFHGRSALNHVYRHGRTANGQYLSLRTAPSNKPDYRLAVVVSKKVSKSAVVRNRIRRRIFEIMRLAHNNSDKPWDVDMVITVHDAQAASVEHDSLVSEIKALLKKARL